MKKVTACSLFAFLVCGAVFGKMKTPTNAIDFTAKDLDGKQHQLFTYLQSNKYVLIEFVATW